MISYKASIAQICVSFRFNDRQWSLTNPRSPNKCFYLVSMIVNDILQTLGRPNMCLFRLYDRQWSLTKPRSHKYVSYMALYDREWSFMKPQSPKYMSYLNSMIVNVLLKSLGRPNIFILFLWSSDSMISYKASVAQICVLFRLNDRQWSLSKPRSPKYLFFICCLWSSMISYKASVAQKCFLFDLYDRQWSLTKPRSPKYVS